MNVKLKNWLMIALKNAVNALLTSGAMMAFNWGAFNYTTRSGWWNLGKLVASVIGAREVAVWGPILLHWSSTSSNPAAQETIPPGGVYVPPPDAPKPQGNVASVQPPKP
jgi:hypothetical protein